MIATRHVASPLNVRSKDLHGFYNRGRKFVYYDIMKFALINILWFLLVTSLTAKEQKIWNDGRITPEQPFRARVIGSVASWGGAIVLLKEENGERYCVANLLSPLFSYRVIEGKDFDKKAWIKKGAIFIEPSVEVDRFSWSMGVHKIGRIFGTEDFVSLWYAKSKPKSEQDGADHPATAPESKAEGGKKPKPESKGRPQ